MHQFSPSMLCRSCGLPCCNLSESYVITLVGPGPGLPTVQVTQAVLDDTIRRSLDPEVRARRFAAWKASLWHAQRPIEGRWARAASLVDAGYPCSGISAGWCPTCGDCICEREEDYPVRDHPDCPLHSADSPHAEGKVD